MYMPRTKNPEKMSMISIHLPRPMIDAIDELVRRGLFPSRSEAIRAALRELLYKYGFSQIVLAPKEEGKSDEPTMPVLEGRQPTDFSP